MSIENLCQQQKAYYNSQATKSYEFRRNALQILEKGLKRHENDLMEALYKDLRKAPMEAYMSEMGMVYEELRYVQKRFKKWMKPLRVKTPLTHFYARSFQIPEPYGSVLIMAPWNYPLQLSLLPLIGAISAGNCIVLKPSVYARHTSAALADLIEDCFPSDYICVVQGGRTENESLLEQVWEYIFFTGSVEVGKLVMQKAAEHLTPVTLELGGKSPCIVDRSADLDVAARRIAFGKVLNAGQTCVAPDYLLIDEKIKNSFLLKLIQAFEENFPDNSYDDLPCIINEKHFNRLSSLLQSAHIYWGGKTDSQKRIVEPAIVVDVSMEETLMREEIFGPILPVIPYRHIDDAIAIIQSRPKPLAFYLFTKNKEIEKKMLASTSFGGGCINDTIVHIATSYMPFGGVGESGMGSYHGKKSFETFSHTKSLLKKANRPDLSIRNHPYTDNKLRLMKKLMK